MASLVDVFIVCYLISDYPFSQDILLIIGSVLFFGEQVTPMQVFGESKQVLRLSDFPSFFFLCAVAYRYPVLPSVLPVKAVVMSAAG